jgi:serine/threonine-protein kinase
MAMELLEGRDLKEVIRSRDLRLGDKLSVMDQICEGLAFAHAKGVVHRDLKPGNIHLQPNGQVKILDFGLALLGTSDMTKSGTVMGTPHYMSPEQVRGQRADARSDVFSLGLFYEVLTGRRPFDAESMHGVLYRIMQEEPVPVREAGPGTPEGLAHVVEKALSKNPPDRYANAGDMVAALRQARRAATATRVEAPSSRSPGAGPPERRAAGERAAPSSRSGVPPASPAGSRRMLLVALALGLLAVAVGGWALRRHLLGPTGPPATAEGEVDSLARRAIDSQVELARRRLDAGQYQDAVREASQALRLDPQNAPAREVMEEAGVALKAIDEAVAALRSAVSAGDRERLAGAAFDLMKLDPAHAEAERAATAAAPAFRPRAEEARRLAQMARREAETAGSDGTAAFAAAVALDQKGAQAMQSGQAVSAARHFLAARLAFDRARRSRL